MTQPDSECSHARLRYHNWMVYAHDLEWQRLGCYCTRCQARCSMTADDYVALQQAAEKALSALGRRAKLP